ncbi:hypothetical protein ACTFIW_002074 [Dictyostelium discoideum]
MFFFCRNYKKKTNEENNINTINNPNINSNNNNINKNRNRNKIKKKEIILNKEDEIDNSFLFFKIWRNNYLKYTILENLGLYEKVFNEKREFTVESLLNYEYREWLTSICIIDSTSSLRKGIIPSQVLTLQIGGKFKSMVEEGALGESLTKLTLNTDIGLENFQIGSIPITLKKIFINSNEILSEHSVKVLRNSFIETIEFGPFFDEPFKSDQFPTSLTSMIFNFKFNQPLHLIEWPINVKRIIFGNEFNSELINLPEDLEYLQFGRNFNQPIDDSQLQCLCPNLLTLKMGLNFNKSLNPYSLSESLTELDLGCDWNHPIPLNLLPQELKILRLSNKFNYPIEESTLPTSLQVLIFGDDWNQPLNYSTVLSSLISLNSITFGKSFNRLILPSILPLSLKSITFGESFNQTLYYNSIPQTVEHIEFGISFDQELIQLYKNDIKKEEDLISILPISLKSIIFGQNFNNGNKSIKADTFPKNVTLIEFGSTFNQIIEENGLPDNLESLYCGFKFNQLISKSFLNLKSLKSLKFGYHFNRELDLNSFPLNSSLKRIDFGKCFNQVLLPGVIPSTCTYLQLGQTFNHPLLKGSIPFGVTTLKLSKEYDHPLPNGILPNSLTFLDLGSNFNKILDKSSIPSSVYELKFSDSFNQQLSNFNLDDDETNDDDQNKKSCLRILTFGSEFNSIIEAGALPYGISTIKFKNSFNQKILPNTFPNSVTSITFSKDFSQDLSIDNIPASVIHIYLSPSYIKSKLSPEIKSMINFD